MSGWTKGGVKAYVGITRCGKTTLAIKHSRLEAAETRFPIVTLDIGRALSFAGYPHASGADEVLYDLYVRRVHPKVWTPPLRCADPKCKHRDIRCAAVAERAKFWKTLQFHGAAHVLCDEIRHIASHEWIEPAFVEAVTVWGHGRRGPVSYYITAQRPAFVHRDLWQACDSIYVFKLAPGADLDRMVHEYGISPEKNKAFGRGQCDEVKLGFDDQAKGRRAPAAAGPEGGADHTPDQGVADPAAPPAV